MGLVSGTRTPRPAPPGPIKMDGSLPVGFTYGYPNYFPSGKAGGPPISFGMGEFTGSKAHGILGPATHMF